MSSMNVSNLTLEALNNMFLAGKRFDKRGLLDYRKIEISHDVSNKAEGNARVKIGKTEVTAGIKLQVGAPYPDSLEKGNLMVSADLLPLASPRFEMGPPDFPGIELPRLVDRAIRESKIINLNELVVVPKEKVWTVIIDIYPINDDGNLIDAATIAAVAALKNAHVPELDKDNRIDYDKPSKRKLPLKEHYPLPFSFYKLGDSIIMDPTREEEEACETRINFGVSKIGKSYMINSSQKSGVMSLSKADLEKMMSIIPGKFDELNEKLKKFL